MSGRFSTSSGTERRRRGTRWARAAVLGLILGPATEAAAQDPIRQAYGFVTAPPPPISNLAWLTGCWERRAGSRLVEEQWMAPRGGTMLGMSRTVRGDTLVEFEQVRIYERGGSLVYAANPSGQEPAEFVSTSITDSMVVFENPAHDFPQRIVYRRAGADSLAASVEGAFQGKPRTVRFPYTRTECPSGGRRGR
jgi:uncharacterized protein DUF6265